MPALINNGPISISANNVNVDLDARDIHFASVTITGTFVGTVSFFVSNDKTNWFPMNLTPSNSITAVTSATAPGAFQGNVQPWSYLRAGTTAYTSGPVLVGVYGLELP